MGLKGRAKEAMVLTSVRVPVSMHAWVKQHGFEYSALLRIKIGELMDAQSDDPRVRMLKEWVGDRNRNHLITTPEELAAKRAELGLPPPGAA